MSLTDLPDFATPTLSRLETRLHGLGFVQIQAEGPLPTGEQLLLLTDDPTRFPEIWDMVVIIPELLTRYQGRLVGAWASVQDSGPLMKRFGCRRVPSMVMLRDGGYVGAVEGLLDWSDLCAATDALIDRPVSRPPIAIATAERDAHCHDH